jgi:hypothetical protein
MLYYTIPGTTNEEIDNDILNDQNAKECNEEYYLYLQELYTRLLLSKQDLKFEKPDTMGLETYKHEWLRIYLSIFQQVLVDLGKVCDSNSYQQ